VFGVPTLAIDGELFWGNDAHPLMAAVLADRICCGSPNGSAWPSFRWPCSAVAEQGVPRFPRAPRQNLR
jgi:hypothetical protein